MTLDGKLRAVKLMCETVARQHLSHKQRNAQIEAVHTQIVVIAGIMADAGLLRDHPMVDGVRAAATLTNSSGDSETHQQVKARLWLAVALFDWLVDKAKLEYRDLPGWWSDVVDIAFDYPRPPTPALPAGNGERAEGDIPF